jgi:hypothetical protein
MFKKGKPKRLQLQKQSLSVDDFRFRTETHPTYTATQEHLALIAVFSSLGKEICLFIAGQ